ncbi:hypothetical protein BU26DRAFT_18405 [Trematosphaeria pertusa]|uniref:Uncharacterized protein n=1 Tax=Trematosphaeria pertusa TaxID=390896 RepID=A0A6A6J0D3_9PLEO|nr:uncharacterized protein BU26DRAFT_18405 [Trematosphaeria pertusa]KAF2256295.1 hypothetical protein BU26DRAFT_18405 [Trematosphaeria pertusa]
MAARPSNRHGRIYLDQEGADIYQCSGKTAMSHHDRAVPGVSGGRPDPESPSAHLVSARPGRLCGILSSCPGSTKQSCVSTRRPAPATYDELYAESHRRVAHHSLAACKFSGSALKWTANTRGNSSDQLGYIRHDNGVDTRRNRPVSSRKRGYLYSKMLTVACPVLDRLQKACLLYTYAFSYLKSLWPSKHR